MRALMVVPGETLQFTVRYTDNRRVPLVDMLSTGAEVRIEGQSAVPHSGVNAETGEFLFQVPPAVTLALSDRSRGVPFQVWITESDGVVSVLIEDAVLDIHRAIPAVPA